MGFWSRLIGRGATKSAGDLDLIRALLGSRESATGRSINVSSALEVTTVLRCVGVLADGVATVPLKLLRKGADGRRQDAADHPLYSLLHDAPNEWQDSLQFRETLVLHLALTGNAFVLVVRVRGQIAELIPIEPGRVTVSRGPDMRLTYKVTPEGGGAAEELPASAVWHLRGASWSSWRGLETVKLAREAIGLALATEEAHARLHRNGVQSTGAYSVEGTLSAEQYTSLREHIRKFFAGTENAGAPLILDRAAKWQPLRMSGVDAEHLATRRHQVEEICRAFGVMPIMVGFTDKASTYASAEQMFLAHAVHTIRPWHRRFEATIRRSLLTEDERRAGLYPKFFDAELMRGASKDRGEFYARALGAGGSPAWMEINEVRGFEDMDDVDWGNGQPVPPNATRPDGGAEGGSDE